MLPKSIRWRLQLWQMSVLTCVLLAFGLTAYDVNRRSRLERIDEELGSRVQALSVSLRSPPAPEGHPPDFHREGNGPRPPPEDDVTGPLGPRGDGSDGPHRPPDWMDGPPEPDRAFHPTAEAERLFDDAHRQGHYYVIWSRTGELLMSSVGAPDAVPKPDRPGRDTAMRKRSRGIRRESYGFTERGDCVLVGVDMTAEARAQRLIAGELALAGLVVLALGFGGGWLLTSHALRPVDAIIRSANRLARGDLSERIAVSDAGSELGQLAGVLNTTFARLEAAFRLQRQFTADASHEFRTPLAVIISEAQTALRRPREAADYRDAIDTCLGAAQQMRRLADSLLELARFDSPDQPMSQMPVDLADVARLSIEQIGPIAVERGMTIHAALESAPTRGNPEHLGRVVTNLLANAMQYGKPSGDIRVVTRTRDGVAILSVADEGEGIAAADLPHLFERFYRADKARSRAEGHPGLGLAICKAIVDVHGGAIDVTSQPGHGSTFTVRVPWVSGSS